MMDLQPSRVVRRPRGLIDELRVHRPDAVVTFEHCRKSLGLIHVNTEYDARVAPWLLYRVAHIAGHRWKRLVAETVRGTPVPPCSF